MAKKEAKNVAVASAVEKETAQVGWMSIAKSVSVEMIERKSRFIGHAAPVTTEAQALDLIRDIRHRYADATHNVYAYVLRQDNTTRYSDDGEPQGTAGIPVLDVIRKRNLTDIVLVVTRYFGGILLGTGGLVRAYGASASQAVDAAGISVFRELAQCSLSCDYTDYQRIIPELSAFSARTVSSDFSDVVSLALEMPLPSFAPFRDRICEITAGRVACSFISSCFAAS